MNIITSFFQTVDKFSNKPAIIFKDKSITFQQLKAQSLKLAYSLQKLGIKKDEKVSIYLPNLPEYFISYLAIYYLGAVAVPLDFMLMQDELRSCLEHSESKILITKQKENISFHELKRGLSLLKNIILVGESAKDFLNFGKLIEESRPEVELAKINEDDDSMILYTSGSTGKPKGIVLSYKHQEAIPKVMKYAVKISDRDIQISTLPLSHMGGYVYFSGCIYVGCTIIIMGRFIPIKFLRNIEKFRVSSFWLVPAMYYALLHLKEFERFDLSSLRWVVVFGAPSAPNALRRFHKYCPNAYFINGWGLTETCGPTVVLPLGSNKIESVGLAPPWIGVKIFDDDDKEVPQGQIGEIVVKSWIVMKGYYKDAMGTSQAMRNGWFHTGDMGRFDKQGYLYIVGRKKEMIKVGGQLVYSSEVEASIHKHPDVSEVAVIGVADDLRGEVPKAFIVTREDRKVAEQDIRDFCRKHLAHFKIPHYFEFRDSLPKTGSGKIDKVALKN